MFYGNHRRLWIYVMKDFSKKGIQNIKNNDNIGSNTK